MKLAAVGAAIATAVTLFGACGGTKQTDSAASSAASGGATGGGGSGGGSSCAPAPSAACKEYATAYCQRLQACASYFFRIYYATTNACLDSVAAGCQAVAALADVGIDDAALKDCAAQVTAGSCARVLATDPFKCKPKPGKRADGKGCAADLQCSSLFCKRAAASDKCGTCAPLPAEGSACKDVPQCGYGLACIESQCNRLRDLNESCVTQGAGPRCAPAYGCVGGKCVKPLAPNAACKVPDPQICDFANGYTCTAATGGTCQPVKSAKVGEKCQKSVLLFCEGAFCKGETDKAPGVCTDYVAMCGKGCKGSPCLGGICQDDQCVPLVIPSCE